MDLDPPFDDAPHGLRLHGGVGVMEQDVSVQEANVVLTGRGRPVQLVVPHKTQVRGKHQLRSCGSLFLGGVTRHTVAHILVVRHDGDLSVYYMYAWGF